MDADEMRDRLAPALYAWYCRQTMHEERHPLAAADVAYWLHEADWLMQRAGLPETGGEG